MSNIKHYWEDKESRAKEAMIHTKSMISHFSKEIQNSINNTNIYDQGFESKLNIKRGTNIILENLDSVSAAAKYNKGKVAILNFASYKNPGGMFLNGSKAQEECLCHSSYLYNVLSNFKDFYCWNNQNKNRALYLNRALYTPNIMFQSKDEEFFYCDVITCAAPNKSAAQKYQHVTDEENTEVLYSRIKFVLDIAKENGVDTLILGAYGCGVFGQDPKEVASIFKKYLTTTHQCFDTVVFGIPSGKDNNYKEFCSVFLFER